jgi:hypothetical protein
MTLAEIREQAIKYALQRGVITDEADINYDSLDTDIISVNSAAIGKMMAMGMKINPSCRLIVPFEAEPELQEDWSRYTLIPVPLAINNEYAYAGSPDLGNNTVRIQYGVGNLSDPVTQLFPSVIRAYVNNGVMRINYPRVRAISLSFAPSDPRTVDVWNQDYDNLPTTEVIIGDVVNMLANGFTKYLRGVPVDRRSDNTDTLINANVPK